MRFAQTASNKQAEVNFSGERAICKDCNSIVIGHKGQFKVKHWKHYKKADCDNWNEPLTEWHLSWQKLFPTKYTEVALTKESIKHRADIRLSNGLVIEIQNSPINPVQIKEREQFYGTNNMIWIINGVTLTNNSFLSFQLIKRQFQLTINIPTNLRKFSEYDLKNYSEALLETNLFKQIISQTSKYDISKRNNITLDFVNDIDLFQLKSELSETLELLCKKIYGINALKSFQIEYFIRVISVKEDSYENIRLIKKNWRRFIDLFTFPLFIDNLAGLDKDKIYWYQKNKIIAKESFLTKYKKYCL